MSTKLPIEELLSAIAALSAPLGRTDRAVGWTDESRRDMLSWMQSILAKAERGIDVWDDCRMIGRTLDELDRGPLRETVMRVQQAARGE